MVNDPLVLITGAASGIGRALALACAAKGARLALCDIDPAGLAAVASPIATARHAAAFDISDAQAGRPSPKPPSPPESIARAIIAAAARTKARVHSGRGAQFWPALQRLSPALIRRLNLALMPRQH